MCIKNDALNCGKVASCEVNFRSLLLREHNAAKGNFFCMENPLFGIFFTMEDKALVTPLFAAERGGSLTELAAAGFENATNFFLRDGYTHGTAAVRRGSDVCLSECGDVTELSGKPSVDSGDEPFIRVSAAMVAQRFGCGSGGTVRRRVHDSGISFSNECAVACSKSVTDWFDCLWMEPEYAKKNRNVCVAQHGAGGSCDGVER